ncbi:hypothetical protein AN2335V1_5015 (plasmid) [Klebsiella variicola]|uniref:Uncharacterized protein n=1 Tax=Klebsiella variicola TaxID=244366 RepID=A0A9P0Y751_KLEVA|nr:hypothetical protein AN2335V1_5015 [Klebsiella variicola]
MLRAGTIEEQQLIVRADSRRAPVVTVVNISRMLWVQGDDVTSVYRISLKSLALRSLELHDDIASLVVMIAGIVDELAPELIKRHVVGYQGASPLLITAGGNPQRLRSGSGLRHGEVPAWRPSNRPRRDDWKCLLLWGQSIMSVCLPSHFLFRHRAANSDGV